MENKEIENRQLLNPNQQDNWPETLKNPIYTPAFLREQIGKLMRVEFLIGTNNLVGTSIENLKKLFGEFLKNGSKKAGIPELWDGKASERIIEILLKK